MTRPLRVAHVVASSGATGVEAHLVALLAAFDRRAVDPVLFCPRSGPLVDRLRARGVAVEFGAPTRKLAFAEEARLARRWAGAFDLVHAHGPRAAFWAGRAARRAGIRAFVVTLHELRWLTQPAGLKRTLWIALEARGMARATRLIAVSTDTRCQWAKRAPGLADRMTVVHGSTPLLLDAASLPQARPRGAGGPLRLVTVGRFNEEKGYDRLLGAVARLRDAGHDARLTAVGASPVPQQLTRLAATLGIADHVSWVHDPEDLAALLAAGDCFVTGTRAETFGVAVLEAMAVGLPVVAPAVGGLNELVVSGETGELVPADPSDGVAPALARAIESVTADPERAARLGRAGWSRARDAFGPDRMATSVTEVYRGIVASDATIPSS